MSPRAIPLFVIAISAIFIFLNATNDSFSDNVATSQSGSRYVWLGGSDPEDQGTFTNTPDRDGNDTHDEAGAGAQALTSHKVLLDCRFDMDHVIQAKNYREPLHFFSEDDWAKITGQPHPPFVNQSERIDALVGTVRVARDFLDARLNATWWVRSGMLIGMHRFGDILPWDTDIDLDMLMDDHVRLYHMVLKMPGMRNTTAEWGWTHEQSFCNNTRGDMCVAAPVSATHWVMSSKPLNIETHNYKRAYARFIDIRTGHFSEIFGTIDDKENDKLLTNVKWWWRPGVPREMILPVRYSPFRNFEVPIPRQPFVLMNGSFYETFVERHEGRALIPMYVKDVKPGCVVVECTFPTSAIDSATGDLASRSNTPHKFRHDRFALEVLRQNASNYLEVARFFTSDANILGEFNGTAGIDISNGQFCEPSSQYFVGEEVHVDNEHFCPECHEEFIHKW